MLVWPAGRRAVNAEWLVEGCLSGQLQLIFFFFLISFSLQKFRTMEFQIYQVELFCPVCDSQEPEHLLVGLMERWFPRGHLFQVDVLIPVHLGVCVLGVFHVQYMFRQRDVRKMCSEDSSQLYLYKNKTELPLEMAVDLNPFGASFNTSKHEHVHLGGLFTELRKSCKW